MATRNTWFSILVSFSLLTMSAFPAFADEGGEQSIPDYSGLKIKFLENLPCPTNSQHGIYRDYSCGTFKGKSVSCKVDVFSSLAKFSLPSSVESSSLSFKANNDQTIYFGKQSDSTGLSLSCTAAPDHTITLADVRDALKDKAIIASNADAVPTIKSDAGIWVDEKEANTRCLVNYGHAAEGYYYLARSFVSFMRESHHVTENFLKGQNAYAPIEDPNSPCNRAISTAETEKNLRDEVYDSNDKTISASGVAGN